MNFKTKLNGYYVICLVTLTLSVSCLAAQEFEKDLVLALTFDEGAGNTVKDKSAANNDAQIDGNANWITGKIGGGFQFDGKTWVVAPHISLNDRDFTVQLWVKTQRINDQEVVFSQYESNAKNLSLHLRVYQTGMVRLGFYSNDLDSQGGIIEKNQWHNLTFVVDDSDKTRQIYVDGNLVANGVSDGSYLGATGDTIIGGWDRVDKGVGKAYQAYMGSVDEVRVWQRLLEEDEIIASMNTAMPVDSKGKITTIWAQIKRGF
ncbi:LamG domain-containing protein [Candidatus Poribacteria bacterium]|nr:LamG domain-containing protein [Candidatus Poribacteria bacterium]